MLVLKVFKLLVQLLDLGLIVFLFAVELGALLDELIEAGLVLAGHVGDDVPLPVLLLPEQLLQLQIAVSLLILRSLRSIGHLLLHD